MLAGDVHRSWRGLTAVVEEKVDGANAGVFFEGGEMMLQSRGHVLRGGRGESQFAPFHVWAAERSAELRAALGDSLVLYGEWCFAKHRAYYDALPDWFLGFDVLDRAAGEFLTTPGRDRIFASARIAPVPRIWTGRFDKAPAFASLVGRTGLRTPRWKESLAEEARRSGARDVMSGTDPSDMMEGVYVRVEDGSRVVGRMKLHRDGFEKVRNDDWGRVLVRNSRS